MITFSQTRPDRVLMSHLPPIQPDCGTGVTKIRLMAIFIARE
ncbi:MAG: hypothetical protein RIM23_26715 [Coleofasciculus sp. G3-WIS-01]